MEEGQDSDSEEDEVPRGRRGQAAPPRRDRVAEKEKARKKLREDIAQAAGGPLTGIE